MLPYWPAVTPLMPTTAWAIIPSAGHRRGSDGIAGTSYSVRAKRTASPAERWGSEPTPVAVPGPQSASRGTPRASNRCALGQPETGGSSSSPLPAVCPIRPRWLQSAGAVIRRTVGRVPPAAARAVVWVARAAWLAVAIAGGCGDRRGTDDTSRAVQLVGTRRRGWDGRSAPSPWRAERCHAHHRQSGHPRVARRRRRRPHRRRRAGDGDRPARPRPRRQRPRRDRRVRARLHPGVGLWRRVAFRVAPPDRLPPACVATWLVTMSALVLALPRSPVAPGYSAIVCVVVAVVGLARTAAPVAPTVAPLARARAGRNRRPRPGRPRRHVDAARARRRRESPSTTAGRNADSRRSHRADAGTGRRDRARRRRPPPCSPRRPPVATGRRSSRRPRRVADTSRSAVKAVRDGGLLDA